MANTPRRPGPGRSYGSAGKSLGSDSAQARFGDRAAVGAVGEKAFARLANEYRLNDEYFIYYSLRIPKTRGGTSLNSDVDVALTNGRKLILVDVKMWKSGVHWWSFAGKAWANLAPQHALSQNMKIALERYREALPGVQVDALVLFVPSGKRQSLPASVHFLRWPGGIRSKMVDGGVKYIRRFLGKPDAEGVDGRIQSVLGQMVRR